MVVAVIKNFYCKGINYNRPFGFLNVEEFKIKKLQFYLKLFSYGMY
jgi:hypothetical protein